MNKHHTIIILLGVIILALSIITFQQQMNSQRAIRAIISELSYEKAQSSEFNQPMAKENDGEEMVDVSKEVEPIESYKVLNDGTTTQIYYYSKGYGTGFTLSYPSDVLIWGIPQVRIRNLTDGGSPRLEDYPRLFAVEICAQYRYCNIETKEGWVAGLIAWNQEYRKNNIDPTAGLEEQMQKGNLVLLGQDKNAAYTSQDFIETCKQSGYCNDERTINEISGDVNNLLSSFQVVSNNK